MTRKDDPTQDKSLRGNTLHCRSMRALAVWSHGRSNLHYLPVPKANALALARPNGVNGIRVRHLHGVVIVRRSRGAGKREG